MISFVGAGPGAIDLITLRGQQRLASADLVIWASSLIPSELLAHCGEDVELFDSSGMTLEDVLAIYAARSGENIVRLHSGDPSIYGAIAEQIEFLEKNEIEFEVIPGVTSASAASAVIAKEFTVPGKAQSVVYTRIEGKTSASIPPGETVANYSKVGGTLAIFLSGAMPEKLQQELLCPDSVFSSTTPAYVVVRVTWPDEQIVETTVGKLSETMKMIGATRTVLVLVGDALAGQGDKRSHLYNPTFAHRYRKRSKPGDTTGRPTGRSKRVVE